MRLLALIFVSVAAVHGSEETPKAPGILRGAVVQSAESAVTVRTSEGRNWTCVLDRKTWMERNHRRIDAGGLEPDDPVEVVTDYKGGDCYARLLRVLPPANVRARRRLTVKPIRTLDHVFPRGNLTFAGVVLRSNEGLLVLRTRQEPELFVFLRDDTRFMNSGVQSTRAELPINTRVFIRAGKNFEEQTEAFQVIWGNIAGPHRTHP